MRCMMPSFHQVKAQAIAMLRTRLRGRLMRYPLCPRHVDAVPCRGIARAPFRHE